jgi:hypothetical protein
MVVRSKDEINLMLGSCGLKDAPADFGERGVRRNARVTGDVTLTEKGDEEPRHESSVTRQRLYQL